MNDTEIILADELVNDPYPDGHPWSVKIERNNWNGAVTIVQGGLGTRPIYIYRQNNMCIVGSKISDMLEKPPALTPGAEGRMEMLLFGHTSGMNTLFDEIRRVPPGDHHKLTSNGIHSEWRDRICESGPNTPDKTADVFINCTRRRVDKNPAGWLPLTGGVDSRTIAAVLSNAKGIRTYTRGQKTHPEVQYAAEIASKLNLNHYPIPFNDRYISNMSKSIVRYTGGMVSFDHGHAIHPLSELKRLSPGIIVPGINGEYGRAFWAMPGEQTAGISVEEAAKNLFLNQILTRDSRYEDLFERDALPMIETIFENWVRRYCDAAECACYAHPLAWNDEFYLRERVRSFSSFGAVIWSAFFTTETPFLENDYIQSVRTLPPKLRSKPNIHIRIIQKLKPKLLRIPLFPSGKPLTNRWYDFAGNTLRRQLNGKHGRQGAHNYAEWLRKDSDFLEPLIQKAHEHFCGFIRQDMVKKLWAEHQSGVDHHRVICRLLTPVMVDELFKK